MAAAAVQEQWVFEATIAHTAASIRTWLVSFAACVAHFVGWAAAVANPRRFWLTDKERNIKAKDCSSHPFALKPSSSLSGSSCRASAQHTVPSSGRVNDPNQPTPRPAGTMYGLSGVLAIVSGLAKGESLEQLELKELPNMPFLYWLVRTVPAAGAAQRLPPCQAPQHVLMPVAAGHRQCHRQAQVD